MPVNRQWLLAARPQGMVRDTDFRWHQTDVAPLRAGEFLVKSIYLSLAPVMRMYMLTTAAGEPPVELGAVMRGRGVGQIVDSRHAEWPVGAIVHGPLGWQDFATLKGDAPKLTFQVTQRIAPVSTALGVLGITGFTAYVGLIDLCTPQTGDVVVVSGASGGVGSNVGQLAKIFGCTTIAITGGGDKVALATSRLGYDFAVDYAAGDVEGQLDRCCPQGVDVYFDNVGGPTLNSLLGRLRQYGRVALCGRISEYVTGASPDYSGFANFVRRRARIQGFFIYDYVGRFAHAEAAMARWLAEGRLIYQEDVLDGLEAMPRALRRLYESKNRGKQIVRISEDPAGWPTHRSATGMRSLQ
jgi:NADPH-dependent curcumin reductase CurA